MHVTRDRPKLSAPFFVASFFPLHSTTARITLASDDPTYISSTLKLAYIGFSFSKPFIDFPGLSHYLGVWARSFFGQTILESHFLNSVKSISLLKG